MLRSREIGPGNVVWPCLRQLRRLPCLYLANAARLAPHLCYDFMDGRGDRFWRYRTVIATWQNNLASARRELREFRLHFMNPNLLISSGLPI